MTRRQATVSSWRGVRAIVSTVFPTGTRLLHEWTLLTLMVVFFGGVGVVLWQMSATSSTFAEAEALEDATHTSELLESFRTLYTSDVVDRVRRHGIAVTHDYEAREGSIPLPATLSMKLGDLIAQQHMGSSVRLYSDHPFPWREDGGSHDVFEAEALVELRRNPDRPFVRIEDYQGRQSLRYAIADRMRASCVSCHNSHPDSSKTDWKVGDVRGVLEVVTPLDGFVAHTNAQLRDSFVLFMTLAAFGFAVVAFVVVSARRNLEVLRKTEPGSMAKAYEEGDHELVSAVSRGKLLLLGVVMAGAVLAFDLSIPLGVAAGVPYVLLVLLSLRSNRESHAVVAAAGGTALTILGFVLSPAGGEIWKVLANRFLAIFAIWVTAILCIWQQRRTSEQTRLVTEKAAAEQENDLVKETLRKLEESEARTRAIVDTAADGVITIDEKGTIQSFNGAAEKISGYSESEAIGKNVNLLMPSPFREEHDTYVQRYLETGVKTILAERREVIGRRKDGSTFPMDLCVSEARLGDRRMFTGIVRDITRRKSAEEKIARQRDFLHTVIESLDHPFLVIDAEDYSVSIANAAARRDAPQGARTCHAMTHRRDTPCDGMAHTCPLAEVKRTGKPFMVEHVHTHADGSPMPVEVHAFPVFDESGRLAQLIEYSLDITDRKKTEEELRRSRHEIEETNARLTESMRELEAFNTLAVGRELRMIELKEEINALLSEHGESPKYEIVQDEVMA